MECLLKAFDQVSDPRSLRNQKHPLAMLIGTSMLASLAGIDSFSGFADFTECHQESLKAYFDFPCGPPSHDTYQRLWDAINPDEFHEAFHEFTLLLSRFHKGYIHIDGKAVRNSGFTKALPIVNAWCEANHLTLAQVRVDEKRNEITAIPKLLKLLDIEDRIITIDAMGAQREICAQIIEGKGDYVISLKKNQRSLYRDVVDYFAEPKLLSNCVMSQTCDKGHGRLEKRTAYCCDEIKWLEQNHHWPGLKSIAMVESQVEKNGKCSTEKRYYISSLAADAQRLNDAARSHWAIENKLHWRLDVVFNEDKACIRRDNAVENISILRKWAFNLLHKAKEKPTQSIKGIMRKNAMSFKNLEKSINRVFHA